MRHRSLGLALAACTFLGAQTLPDEMEEPPAAGWRVNLGAAVLSGPRYPGAGEQRVILLPVFNATYGERFYFGTSRVAPGAGFGVHALRGEHWSWDLGLGVGEGRREKRADVLAGLGDRAPAFFAGTGLRFHAGAFHAGLRVASGLNDQAGVAGAFSIGYAAHMAPRWLGHASLSADWSDTRNMAFWFGITPEQAAARSGLLAAGDSRLRVGEDRAFAPKAGVREVALAAGLTFLSDAHWRWFGIARLQMLQGEARLSPLVRRDSDANLGIGFAYRF